MVGHACIGHLTPAENLMEENPEGPDVRLDGVVPSGKGLGSCPLVGDVAGVGEVDVLLQSDRRCGAARSQQGEPAGTHEKAPMWEMLSTWDGQALGYVGAKEDGQVGRAGKYGHGRPRRGSAWA